MSDLLSHLSIRALSPGATVLPRIPALFESIAEPEQAPIGETESFLEETEEVDSEESRSIRKSLPVDLLSREEPARHIGLSNAESDGGAWAETNPDVSDLPTNAVSERGEIDGNSHQATAPASGPLPPSTPLVIRDRNYLEQRSVSPAISADNSTAPRAAAQFQITGHDAQPQPASYFSPSLAGAQLPPRASAAKPAEKASPAIDSGILGHLLKQLRAGQAVHQESEDRRSAPVMPQPSSKPVAPLPIAFSRAKPAQADPVIEVSIGRIEVHTPAQRTSTPRPTRGGSSVMTLEQYLRLRNGGRR